MSTIQRNYVLRYESLHIETTDIGLLREIQPLSLFGGRQTHPDLASILGF